MDRRIVILAASTVLLAGLVLGIALSRGGDDDGGGGGDLSNTSVKPVIEVPDEPPPTEVVSEDIVTGEGPEVKVGDTIAVEYVGVIYETGKEFDSSWETPGPVPFPLSPGGLIDGWIQAVPGMQVGGRRKLTIPAELAYGAEGRPGIPPNSALVFVIDLKQIQ